MKKLSYHVSLFNVCSFFLCVSSLVLADSRDDDIFGDHAQQPSSASASESALSEPSNQERHEFELTTIGGRFDLNWNHTHYYETPLSLQPFSANQAIDLFFDTRIQEDSRALVRLRFQKDSLSEKEVFAIDESWIRWNAQQHLFMTLGKQHLKWGSGRFWNPTDFLAVKSKDAFASIDRRLGQHLFKIHIPDEKNGHNYYFVTKFDGMKQTKDIEAALRGEWVFAGLAEFALTAAYSDKQKSRFGADLSSALGVFDAKAELAFLDGKRFKKPKDPINSQTVSDDVVLEEKSSNYLLLGVYGLSYSYNYTDTNSINFGLEFFDNQAGYERIGDELYAFAAGLAEPMYLARHYVSGSVFLTAPGKLSDWTFSFLGVLNLTDNSHIKRIGASYEVKKGFSTTLSLSRSDGKLGEFALYMPKEYQKLISGLAQKNPLILAMLPEHKASFSFDVGVLYDF